MADRQSIQLLVDNGQAIRLTRPITDTIVLKVANKEVFNSLATNPVSNSDARAPLDKSVNYELVATPVINHTYFYKKINEDSYTKGMLTKIVPRASGGFDYAYNAGSDYVFDNYDDKVDQVYIEVNRGGKSRRKKLRKSKKRRSYRKKF